MAPYIFDNRHAIAPSRFEALETLFDAQSIENLRGAGVRPGWKCLDVGAGSGSISRWLGKTVGLSGRVTATDIDIRHFDALGCANVQMLRHDIVADTLPDSFDLVHARLLLVIVPERERALERMLGALKPGGIFAVEEMDAISMGGAASIGGPIATLESIIAARRVMGAAPSPRRTGRDRPQSP